MKAIKNLITISILTLSMSSPARAGTFDWFWNMLGYDTADNVQMPQPAPVAPPAAAPAPVVPPTTNSELPPLNTAPVEQQAIPAVPPVTDSPAPVVPASPETAVPVDTNVQNTAPAAPGPEAVTPVPEQTPADVQSTLPNTTTTEPGTNITPPTQSGESPIPATSVEGTQMPNAAGAPSINSGANPGLSDENQAIVPIDNTDSDAAPGAFTPSTPAETMDMPSISDSETAPDGMN